MNTTTAKSLTQQMPPLELKVPLPNAPTPPVVSKSILTGAAEDASRIMFEVLGMEFDQEMIDRFMKTRNGKKMEACMARMFAHISEELIARLDKVADK